MGSPSTACWCCVHVLVPNTSRTSVCCCVLQVTLWNRGVDAYQHERYGDWLTIERVIKQKGGTQYKIYSSSGKKVR